MRFRRPPRHRPPRPERPPRDLRRARPRWALPGLLAALAAIAIATLRPGDAAHLEPTSLWCLVCGSFGLVDVAQNVVLFVPLGVALRALGLSRLAAVACGLLASVAVEGAQLLVLVGRDPALSDLLTNTTGTLLGVMVADWWRRVLWPGPRFARLLAALTVGAWVASAAVTAWLLRPDVPTGTGYWTNPVTGRRNPTFAPFTGEVRSVALNGEPLRPARLRDATALLPRLRARPLVVTATVRPGAAVEREQLVASVFTFGSQGVVLLTRDGDDLRFSVRTRSARLRLRTPIVALRGAFAGAGAWMDVGGAEDRAALRVWAVRDGARREASVPRTPFLAWALVSPIAVPLAGWATPLSALWLAAPLALASYWLGRGTTAARPRVTLALLAPLVAASLVLVPLAAGLAAARWWEWLAAAAGLALGALAARASVRPHLAPASRQSEYLPS